MLLKAGGTGHETGKLKLMMITCTLRRKWSKNPGKGSTLRKNMLLLAIDVSKSQCFVIAVITNKTKGELVGRCYIIRLTGLSK